MTTLGVIALVVYVVGYVPVWRRLAFAFVRDFAGGMRADWFEVSFGTFLATLAAFLWPGVLVVWVLRRRDPEQFIRWVGRPPPEAPKQKAERLERERREREHHIERLEREVGL